MPPQATTSCGRPEVRFVRFYKSANTRVRTDAAARAACRRVASGSVPARGTRLSGHPRPAAAAAGALPCGDGSASANVPTRRDRDGFERAASPYTTGSA